MLNIATEDSNKQITSSQENNCDFNNYFNYSRLFDEMGYDDSRR